jgi:hypothetical protein
VTLRAHEPSVEPSSSLDRGITTNYSRRPRGLISYQPPDEGQPLRAKDVRGAYHALNRFLEHCTDARAPESASLVASEPTRLTPPGYESGPIIDRLTRLLGAGERSQVELAGPSGAPTYAYTWRLNAEALERAVGYLSEILSELPAQPPIYVPPVYVSALFTFALRDPRTGEVLPHQGPEWVLDQAYAPSWAVLLLGSAPSARVELQLPFEEPGPEFHAYLEAIRPYLPVQIAWSRFRLLTPNSRGTGYTRRVIRLRAPRRGRRP